MSNTIRILSLDGGGIRVIIPTLVMSEIEERTGRRIADCFDLITGTSTGGIIAIGLTIPGEDGKAMYSARDMVNLFENEGKKIFHRSVWRTLESGWNLLDEKYDAKGMEGVLETYFGDSRLKDALTNLLITSYEIEARTPWFFRSYKARASRDYDFPMAKVARAASAAPTYFEPLKLNTENELDYYSLIDGGVYANNPGMCGYVEARSLFPDASDFMVVSLGTGEMTRRIPYKKAKDWGLAQWAHPILNIMFDGMSDTVDYQLRQLLRPHEGNRRYFRFQTRLDSGNDDLDDASEKNIRDLKLESMEMLEKRHNDLLQLCDILSKG